MASKAMISDYRAHLLVMAGALLAACDVGVERVRTDDRRDDRPLSVGAFAESMAQGKVNAFVADLNEVRDPDPDPEILTYLVSVWRDARGETPPRFLQDELVQVELATTLAQARKNAAVDFDDELHEFIRRAARSGDGKIRQRAVLGLAIFRDPMDIPIIAQMTADHDEPTFRMAVIVLSNGCLPEARVALDNAESSLSRERAAFLEETREMYGCRKRR